MIGRAASAALAGCAFAACALGCAALQPQSMRIDSAAGMYQGVTITYRVDGGQLNEPLTVARIAGHQVTQQSVPSSPYPDRSVARLSIRYPHPDGKADYALVELVVETPAAPYEQTKKSTWQQWVDTFAATARDILPGVRLSSDVHEAWAMDIAKSDLDRVIGGMAQGGYFVNPSKATVGVELAARIDNFQADKRWSREPDLDSLMERIRQEGRLVSYVHPVASGGTAVAAASTRTPARLVSHEEDGPALVPAGPQNNAYSNPPESRTPARTPQCTPPPTNLIPAPYSAPPYTPGSIPAAPAAPTTVSPYSRPSMPNLMRPPAAAPNVPPAAESPLKASPRNTPQSKMPRSKVPQSKRPSDPTAKPNGRWQYPPQYRRQASPPSASSAPGAAGQPSPTARQEATRNQAQQRQQRAPWRRPAAADAQQQQAPALPSANAANPAARPRLQRVWGTPGQQPPASGRLQPRYPSPPGYQPPYQPPPRYPSTPYGSAQNAPSSTYPETSTPASEGYPAGIPQPPQIGSRSSNAY